MKYGYLTKNTVDEILVNAKILNNHTGLNIYPLKIQYFLKSKLFRITHKEAFLTSQIEIEKLIKKLDYKDLNDFKEQFNKEFKLREMHLELQINLVCFKKFDVFFLTFIE